MNKQPTSAAERDILVRLTLRNPRAGVAGAQSALEALRDDRAAIPLIERFNLARDVAALAKRSTI
jgi:hypothetical protein